MESCWIRYPLLKTIADLSNNNTWDHDLTCNVFGEEIGSEITKIPRLPLEENDCLIWKNNVASLFSVKEAYLTDQGIRFEAQRDNWRWIWKLDIHPRISMTLWRAIQDILPTRDKLHFATNKD
ncbi:hypothetical protein CsatB_013561 [Cannabis sativa]